ncbi:DASH family cryptochrome [Exilibacterium tricleocarpae]|uniref:Cryptochrome DASH n=1 Tax=Exilibacterium tricleocarpae TaxID=2591008 RepID=A0A545TKC3_9GAMM|nr:DASH family cryptochrome [Exilibacterium tricleocarpae]
MYWFTNDLRIEDNRALSRAAERTSQLLCCYVVDPSWFTPNRYGLRPLGDHRWRFLYQTLVDLKHSLEGLGQDLLIIYQSPLDALAQLISQYDVDGLFRSQNAGFYENGLWQTLQRRYQFLHFEELATHTLFTAASLPFALSGLPATFSKFRKLIEPLNNGEDLCAVIQLPPPPRVNDRTLTKLPSAAGESKSEVFKGGANEGHRHLSRYFGTRLPSSYKQVRNALDGWENSTKFSPWLANGSLSARQILSALRHYESGVEANESTYWIQFELLWREYFQWLAHAHQATLFTLHGISRKKVLTSFYPERFQRWCQGNTPFPLVNACMKQLNATGYMSNRGRQIVASCFVNELDLDWRYGAAYFEQQLVDYDVAVNWGNWQYLAGVGTDPRGKRHFDIEKQTKLYDPDKRFIAKWRGETGATSLDSVDAADWPIINSESLR